MKRYAEYKDSGIEWIGSAPIEWSICTLKRVVNLKTDKVDFIGQNYMGLENVESHTGRYVKSGSQEVEGLSTSFQRGDVLFGKLRPYLTKCIIPEFSGICSSEFLVLRNFNGASKYLQYFLLSSQVIEAINASTYGAKMPRANWSYIGQMQIPVPPTPVQQSIVAYLDRKTTTIDGLIADKQKLVELLQEKRNAVISETVTKGLDKTAKMKDSGIEWIGEIPGDFTVQKLKFFTEVKDGTHDTPEYVDASLHSVPLITSKDIKKKQITFDNAKHISPEDHYKISKRSNVEIHNVIMPMIGTVGNPAIVMTNDEFSIKNVALFKTPDIITAQYLQYYLDSELTQYQFDLLNRGGVQQFVSLDILNNLYIIIPSDIKNMVQVLDSKTFQIDTLIFDINEQIEKLKEYRQAVISEAVTGKVAV